MLMKIYVRLVAISILLMLCGCGRSLEDIRASQAKELKRGYEELAAARVFKDKLGGVSSIANFLSPNGGEQWGTVFVLKGRYECRYRVPMKRHEDGTYSYMKGEASLSILTITKIDLLDGGERCMLSYGEGIVLDAKQIEAFIESGFDLDLVGLKGDVSECPNSERIMQYYRQIYPDIE